MARPKRPAAAARRGKAARAPLKSPAGGADNSSVAAGFPLAELHRLIELVQETGIGELEVASGNRSVRISAHGVTVATGSSMQAVRSETAGGGEPSSAPAKSGDEHLVAISSPMVGTFYRAPAPDADPYVEAGMTVEVGQTVCIVEAMKLMNEIESEVKGRIVRILVENAQPVEFGQKLFLVEPA